MPRFSGHFHIPRPVDFHRHREVREEIAGTRHAPLTGAQVAVYGAIGIAVVLVIVAAVIRIF